MPDRFYHTCRTASRCIKALCIRERILFPDRAAAATPPSPNSPAPPSVNGRTTPSHPLLLAVTHLSHLEPVFVTAALRRPVRWMTRVEFYPTWWGRLILDRCGAFPVDRFGFSLPAVRRAIRLLRQGEVVGIFPEGGVATGPNSVLRGGPLKQGVCTVSIRTGVPIVPVIVLGTHRLNRPLPWLPLKLGRVWIAFGRPVPPPPHDPRHNRRDRAALADRLRDEFMATYGELLETEGLRDENVP